jgi:dTMP kinase
MRKGKIITFEGGEGAGKSTQAARFISYLESKGLPCLLLREPGGSSFSEEVRVLFFREGLDAMTELLLVLASRRQNITEIIGPALARNIIVVIDRFIDSTLVYQGMVDGLGVENVRSIMKNTGTWLEPDLTFILDVDPEVSLARIVPGDKFERRDRQFHEKLRDAYREIAKDPRHYLIDSGRDRDKVQEEIRIISDSLLSGYPKISDGG